MHVPCLRFGVRATIRRATSKKLPPIIVMQGYARAKRSPNPSSALLKEQ